MASIGRLRRFAAGVVAPARFVEDGVTGSVRVPAAVSRFWTMDAIVGEAVDSGIVF